MKCNKNFIKAFDFGNSKLHSINADDLYLCLILYVKYLNFIEKPESLSDDQQKVTETFYE